MISKLTAKFGAMEQIMLMLTMIYNLLFQRLTFQTFAYTLDWKLEESEFCEVDRRRSLFMPGINSLLPELPLLLL